MADAKISNNRALELIEAALEIEQQDAKEAGQVGFMPRVLVQTTLPYRDPKTKLYERQNGNVKMSLYSPNGVPYGSIPRFLVSYLASEAVKTQSPVISLGRSQNQFLELLGMRTAGGAVKARLKNQSRRFFTSLLTIEAHVDKVEAIANIMIASKAYMAWSPKHQDQLSLWDSTMTLTDEFFRECIEHPIPIDLRVMDVLSPSPMAMDVYVWLTYRIARCQQSSTLPWELLMLQFGSKEGTEAREFKRQFLSAIKQVETAANWHPSVSIDRDGLTIFPGNPHVNRVIHPCG